MSQTHLPFNGIHLRGVLPADLPVFFQHRLCPEATGMSGFTDHSQQADDIILKLEI